MSKFLGSLHFLEIFVVCDLMATPSQGTHLKFQIAKNTQKLKRTSTDPSRIKDNFVWKKEIKSPNISKTCTVEDIKQPLNFDDFVTNDMLSHINAYYDEKILQLEIRMKQLESQLGSYVSISENLAKQNQEKDSIILLLQTKVDAYDKKNKELMIENFGLTDLMDEIEDMDNKI